MLLQFYLFALKEEEEEEKEERERERNSGEGDSRGFDSFYLVSVDNGPGVVDGGEFC